MTAAVPAPLAPDYFAQQAIAPRLKAWTIELALPLWSKTGRDPRGGFLERMHRDGSPDLAAARRTRVQARQIYVYAHAAALGWFPPGLALALDALEFLLARCRAPDGKPGYVHLLAADGSVQDPLRDAYDHAFLLLALCWLAKASGDAQVRRLAEEVLAFCDAHLAAADGTLHEGVPASLPRRQNPHMHWLEAVLALDETLQHPSAPARAARLRGLLTARFLDPQTGTLTEYFGADWQPAAPAAARAVEPGHQAEWSWLLRRHEQRAGLPRDPLASELLRFAVRSAEPRHGFLLDAVDVHGRAWPGAGRRLWPQTELAKAWLAQHEAGDEAAAPAAEAALQALAAHYLCGCPAGGWIDRFDQDGKAAAEHIPASTLYHLFVAIIEADRVLGAA